MIGLLEALGTQSIRATELKQLIGLLKLEDGEEQVNLGKSVTLRSS